MPPAKRARLDAISVFLDSSIRTVEFDESGTAVRVALAHHLPTGASYLLSREWRQQKDLAKETPKGCYVRFNFLDNNGASIWSISDATEANLEAVVLRSGTSDLVPYVYMMAQPLIKICEPGMQTPDPIFMFKVGCSFTPKVRRGALQPGNPLSLKIVKTFAVSDRRGDIASMFACERAVHQKLRNMGGPYGTNTPLDRAGLRGGGEWFYTSTESCEEIVERIGMVVDEFRAHPVPLQHTDSASDERM
jgi:hypothetical protein